MSYKIDLSNNYPAIKQTDTHCLILTPDYTFGLYVIFYYIGL